MIILKAKLKNAIDNANAKGLPLQFTLNNVKVNGSKRGCYGFVRNTDNGSVVYVTTEEPCLSSLHYMYRYANDERDFRGYNNNWANTLDELASSIVKFLEKTPAEARAIR